MKTVLWVCCLVTSLLLAVVGCSNGSIIEGSRQDAIEVHLCTKAKYEHRLEKMERMEQCEESIPFHIPDSNLVSPRPGLFGGDSLVADLIKVRMFYADRDGEEKSGDSLAKKQPVMIWITPQEKMRTARDIFELLMGLGTVINKPQHIKVGKVEFDGVEMEHYRNANYMETRTWRTDYYSPLDPAWHETIYFDCASPTHGFGKCKVEWDYSSEIHLAYRHLHKLMEQWVEINNEVHVLMQQLLSPGKRVIMER